MRQKAGVKGGLRTPHYKNTQGCETVRMGIPRTVEIPMLQHIGIPCEILVRKGDRVLQGQKIGDSSACISAPVHASVSGIVRQTKKRLLPNGMWIDAVVIESDAEMECSPDVCPPRVESREDFIRAIRESGLVGLGGAGFPTHVKMNPPKGVSIDFLIVNGAECEPYITTDFREMMEHSHDILEGISLVTKYLGISKTMIGIEDNKAGAVRSIEERRPGDSSVQVVTLRSRYPQGAEKMLVYSLTKRLIPEGGLPSDVGVAMMNISSISFLARYIRTGMPLFKRRITVDGRAVERPCNLEVYIGTSVEEVLQFCGLAFPPGKILVGGPMMGIALSDFSMPVLKPNNAVLAFTPEQSRIPEESSCIRCGKCVDKCPMKLVPLMLDKAARAENRKELIQLHVHNCIECGNCAYICPTKRHLVQSIRLGKTMVKMKKET